MGIMLFGKGSKSSAEIGPQENVDECDGVDDIGKQLICSQAEMLPNVPQDCAQISSSSRKALVCPFQFMFYTLDLKTKV